MKFLEISVIIRYTHEKDEIAVEFGRQLSEEGLQNLKYKVKYKLF